MTALFALFAVGSVWFFIASAVFLIFLFYCVEHEFSVRSGFIILGYFLFLQFICHTNLIGNIALNPVKTLIVIGSYFLIGFIWSIIKWWILVNRDALTYKRKRLAFLEDCKKVKRSDVFLGGVLSLDTEVPEPLRGEWRRSLDFGFEIPRVHKNKNKISMWIIYWPTSLIWSLLNDFIKKAIDIMILKLRFIYDGMTKSAFKDTNDFS